MATTTIIEIDDFYDYSYQPISRFGWNKPGHPRIEALLASGLKKYESMLVEFTRFEGDFLEIEKDADEAHPHLPHWANGFLPGLDAITLYGLVATKKPKVYCEIGSGHSTRFAALAKAKHSPGTKIVSIDPQPRASINEVADTVISCPLQECDQMLFQELQAGDIFFFDGSHRVLQNSDVTVFFLEILPLIAPGVIIQVHDIYWPSDYPTGWSRRMYSEQYMLGMLLLYAAETIEILFPNAYLSSQAFWLSYFSKLWEVAPFIERHGESFWFTKRKE